MSVFPMLVAIAAAVSVPERAIGLAQHFLAAYGNWAIVLLSVAVAVYHPIGPDLLIILRGLSGTEAFSSAALAAVFTSIGSLLGYFFGRAIGPRILPRILGKHMDAVERFRALFGKYGIWLVAFSAFGPVPLTYVCWIAGLSGMRLRSFALAVVAGATPRFFGEAALVALWGDHVRSLLGLAGG